MPGFEASIVNPGGFHVYPLDHLCAVVMRSLFPSLVPVGWYFVFFLSSVGQSTFGDLCLRAYVRLHPLPYIEFLMIVSQPKEANASLLLLSV